MTPSVPKIAPCDDVRCPCETGEPCSFREVDVSAGSGISPFLEDPDVRLYHGDVLDVRHAIGIDPERGVPGAAVAAAVALRHGGFGVTEKSPEANLPTKKPEIWHCRECGGTDLTFDRSLCACGAMHYFCGECGIQDDECDEDSTVRMIREMRDERIDAILGHELP